MSPRADATTGRSIRPAVRRVVYSTLTLSVVGGVVAVLGAPTKWI